MDNFNNLLHLTEGARATVWRKEKEQFQTFNPTLNQDDFNSPRFLSLSLVHIYHFPYIKVSFNRSSDNILVLQITQSYISVILLLPTSKKGI